MTANLKLIVLKVAGEFLFLFGLLSWIYGVLIQLIQPEYQYAILSTLVPWIHVNALAILGFAIAAIGFLIWRLTKELQNASAK